MKLLSGMLEKQESGSVPGEHVRAAVLAEWHKMNTGTKVKSVKPALFTRFAYGFAAAIIVLSVYFGITSVNKSTYRSGLSVASISGEAYINNTLAYKTGTLKQGGLISTGTDSSVILAADGYSLELGTSTELALEDSGGEKGFVFSMKKGVLTSRSEGRLRYSFICGDYRITPSGTEFRIEMSQGRLTVAVFSGSVLITGPGLKIEVPAGMMWDIADPGSIRSVYDGARYDKTGINGNRSVSGKNTGEDKGNENIVQDAAGGTGKDNGADPDEMRDLKRESREDIKDMKKETRKGRQFRGGN